MGLMSISGSRLGVAFVLTVSMLSGVGCRNTEPRGSVPVPISSWIHAADGSAPDAVAPDASTALAPASSNARWFLVTKGVTPQGVIEFAGRTPVRMIWTGPGEEAEQIAARVSKWSTQPKLGEERHVDLGNGTRGLEYVTYEPGSTDYVELVCAYLHSGPFSVAEIGAMPDANPSANLRTLSISYEGEPAGTIELEGGAAKLTIAAGTASHPSTMLQNYWKQLEAMPSLHVWYTTTKDGNTVLESHQARPDQPNFAALVRIWLLSSTRTDGKPRFQVLGR